MPERRTVILPVFPIDVNFQRPAASERKNGAEFLTAGRKARTKRNFVFRKARHKTDNVLTDIPRKFGNAPRLTERTGKHRISVTVRARVNVLA